MYWVINCLHSQLITGFNIFSVKSSCHVISRQQECFGTPAQVWFAGEEPLELKMSLFTLDLALLGLEGWCKPVLFHQTLPNCADQMSIHGSLVLHEFIQTSILLCCQVVKLNNCSLSLGHGDWRTQAGEAWVTGDGHSLAVNPVPITISRTPVSPLETCSSAQSCSPWSSPASSTESQLWTKLWDSQGLAWWVNPDSFVLSLSRRDSFALLRSHLHQETDEPSCSSIIISV